MVMPFNPHSDGPELPGLNTDYLHRSFVQREAKLQADLDTLNAYSETERARLMGQVVEGLSACDFLGRMAGVEVPTQTMIQATGALNIDAEFINN